jgi:hypothetical protein
VGEMTRRDAMKTALKAGAYAAPVVLTAAIPAAVAAQVSGTGAVLTVVPPPDPTVPFPAYTFNGTRFPARAVGSNTVAITITGPAGTTPYGPLNSSVSPAGVTGWVIQQSAFGLPGTYTATVRLNATGEVLATATFTR